MSTDPKAPAPAPQIPRPLPKKLEDDAAWVAELSQKDKVKYYAAQLIFAQAEDAHEDALSKAAAARDKPQKDLDAAKLAYKEAFKGLTAAMGKLAAAQDGIQKAMDSIDPTKPGDPAKSADPVTELQKKVDSFGKVEFAAVTTAVAAVVAADATARKLAEDKKGVTADKLELDPELKGISDAQYTLAQATAADPLDTARKAFDTSRAEIIATLPNP